MNAAKIQPPCQVQSKYNPYASFPRLTNISTSSQNIPDDQACFELWEKYGMLPNIQRHSLQVARIATAIAQKAAEKGFEANIRAVRAAALLHDLAKTRCIRHGGSHAQLGAAWVVHETGNRELAQAVLFHVFWPWELPAEQDIFYLPFFIIYADKRVCHDSIVSLEERLLDLNKRYGKTPEIISHLNMTFNQVRSLEKSFEQQLGWKLHEDSFDSGGMVS